MTRDQAKKALTDAGFVPTYNAIWDGFPDSLTKVTASDPQASTQEPKGTKVTLIISSAL
jgi:serine/threonine-protein kinase